MQIGDVLWDNENSRHWKVEEVQKGGIKSTLEWAPFWKEDGHILQREDREHVLREETANGSSDFKVALTKAESIKYVHSLKLKK